MLPITEAKSIYHSSAGFTYVVYRKNKQIPDAVLGARCKVFVAHICWIFFPEIKDSQEKFIATAPCSMHAWAPAPRLGTERVSKDVWVCCCSTGITVLKGEGRLLP